MRIVFASLALVAAAANVAVPAFAKSAVAGSEADQIMLKPNAGGKLCTPGQFVTGSILPQRVCKTRTDWMAEGVRFTKPAS